MTTPSLSTKCKNRIAREPQWTLRDLAGYTKETKRRINYLAEITPLPVVTMNAGSHSANYYNKSELLAWFNEAKPKSGRYKVNQK